MRGLTAIQRLLLLDDAALLNGCTETHLRLGGPGGQKRNKTSSAVRLLHRPTGVVVTAGDDRSQRVNKVHALRRLRESIAFDMRTAIDDATQRSELLGSVISDGQLEIGLRDHRYHAVIAEVLDVFTATECEPARTAAFLGTSSGLTKFLARDHKLWAVVQELRQARGLRALRA